MRYLLGLLALVLLTGCGEAPDPAADNFGYGWAYDLAGPSGLRVRFAEGTDVALAPRFPIETFEAHYAAVQACAGLAAPGPLVIITEHGPLPVRGDGIYYTATGTLEVDETLAALAHEYLHHLLQHAGLPHLDHESPLFTDCGMISIWAFGGRR